MKLEDIGKSIRAFREKNGMIRKELAMRTLLSEDTIAAYERGSSNFAVSKLVDICNCLGIHLGQLEDGPTEQETPADDSMELMIYNLDDRLKVADILIKNGYTVAQGKKTKTPTGKQLDYFLRVRREDCNADTSR